MEADILKGDKETVGGKDVLVNNLLTFMLTKVFTVFTLLGTLLV